jgi:WD40 repeat protein
VQDLSGTAIKEYRHAQPVFWAMVSPDGKRVAFADESNVVWMWEVGSNQRRELSRLSTGCAAVAFAPDGETIAVAFDSQVLLLDAAQGQCLAVLNGLKDGVRAIAFNSDGRLLATAGGDNTVRIWELPSGRERYCLWTHQRGANVVVFSPDSKTLAGGRSEVILWDVAGGQELMRLNDHKGMINTLAFSPNGEVLAAGGHEPAVNKAFVTLWYADGARLKLDP